MAPRYLLRSALLFFCLVGLSACGFAPGGQAHGCSGSACCRHDHARPAALGALGATLPTTLHPTPSAAVPTPTRRWSDAAGWPGGEVPAANAVVTILDGEVVLLDVSPPPLGGLTIAGGLVFDRSDLELTADHILVTGGLYIGSEQEPFAERAVITLTGDKAPDDGCLGGNYLALLDGTLELYGDPRGSSWTRLAADAAAGDDHIVVDDVTGWRVGDLLALASTDYYAADYSTNTVYDKQVEQRGVTGIEGNRLYLDAPLAYAHHGTAQTFAAGSGKANTVLQSRAEVARLTRNVTVQGSRETADPSSSNYRFGGQVMAMGQSRVRLDSIELTRMGQAGILLRYPVHWHLMGNAGEGSFVRNSSLHGLYNRCITIHGTNGVLLDGNAAHDTFGHCYFLEDGAETGNVLRGNLALQVRSPAAADALLPTDSGHMGPAAFWITNPANYLIGNVAASSQGSGFWYSLPEHPTGPSYAMFDGANIWPRRTPLGMFADNVAHSNNVDGLHVDRGPRAGSLRAETASYTPRVNPADRDSAPVQAEFTGFVAYKQRNAGAWFRGDSTVLRSALLVDNAVGVTFASRSSGLADSVIVGESSNLGTPESWEPVGADGRTLPKPWDPDVAIRGFEFYDGPVFVTNTHFEAFAPNGLRQAAGISVLDYTSFSLSPLSYASGLSFGSATNRVWLETRDMATYDAATTDSGEDGYRSAVFLDQDGSVTGTAGRYVTVMNPVLAAASCTYRAAWNANVCDGRYASLTLSDDGATGQGFAPLNLRRGNEATTHAMYGSPNGGPAEPNRHYRSIIRLGSEYAYEHTRGTPAEFSIGLGEVKAGDRLVVSVPYRGVESPAIYRDWWIDSRSLLPPYGSVASLRTGTETGYYLDAGSGRLYLLLMVQPGRDYARVTVCQTPGC